MRIAHGKEKEVPAIWLGLPFCDSFMTQSFLSGRIASPVTQMKIETNQIQATDTYKGIDNPGQPGHIAKNIGNQVKTEQADQSPVDSANDNNGKCCTV